MMMMTMMMMITILKFIRIKTDKCIYIYRKYIHERQSTIYLVTYQHKQINTKLLKSIELQ